MTYLAADDRYTKHPYRRCGRSGLKLLPEVSLGLWQQNSRRRSSPLDTQRAILHRAFDLGVTHFDLANNYGPPPGSAEINFGRIFAEDFRPYRDELVISTKAGYGMWPGPYGEWGSRKYLLASLDQSLKRMGLEYVDIFYSHRFDPDTPLEETMGALDSAVKAGKALYAGISSYSPERTRDAAAILKSLGTPLLIHQPSYSMLNRWIEGGLLDVLGREGVGCIAFSPLAQGLLTGKYLGGVPAGSRATRNESLSSDQLSDKTLAHVRKWALPRSPRPEAQQPSPRWPSRGCCATTRITSALIGASSVTQLEENLAAMLGQDGLHAGGDRRHRPAGGRRRDQHLGDVKPGLATSPSRHVLLPVRAAGTHQARGGQWPFSLFTLYIRLERSADHVFPIGVRRRFRTVTNAEMKRM